MACRLTGAKPLPECWNVVNWTLEISIEIYTFSLKTIHLKMSSGKWRPVYLDLNVFRQWLSSTYIKYECSCQINNNILSTISINWLGSCEKFIRKGHLQCHIAWSRHSMPTSPEISSTHLSFVPWIEQCHASSVRGMTIQTTIVNKRLPFTLPMHSSHKPLVGLQSWSTSYG